jgi:hypothetical protein
MIEDVNGLMSQEELENDCPPLIEELDAYLDKHTVLKEFPEAVVYVLAQILHERVNALDLPLESKGAIIHNVIHGFMEFNGDALALYREIRRAVVEQKKSTIQ